MRKSYVTVSLAGAPAAYCRAAPAAKIGPAAAAWRVWVAMVDEHNKIVPAAPAGQSDNRAAAPLPLYMIHCTGCGKAIERNLRRLCTGCAAMTP